MLKSFQDFSKDSRLQIIIDKASVLFHEKGYRATSLEDIAKELGVSKAALYHYIESKEELLFIIYKQVFDFAFHQAIVIASSAFPPDEKLRQIIWGHINHVLIKNIPMFSVFFSMENELSSKYYKKVLEWKKQYNRIIESTIQEGIDQGFIKDMDSPKLLVFAIIGMCSWLYKWYKPDGKWNGDHISHAFIKILEEGYLKGPVKPIRQKEIDRTMIRKIKRPSNKEDIMNRLRFQQRLMNDLLDQLEDVIKET